ncbi:MAG: hypothetical protein ACREQH_12335, partial [Candidatus Binatus sp.]
MFDQATKIVRRLAGWRRLTALIGFALVALTGCFGAEAMRYDIQEYNKQIVYSEQKMLLFNIGRLKNQLPPHFMMLATVSQSRTFSGSSGFSWANPATWSVPFSATGTENPTIQFVPVQGQDFANRFESPLTDKFTLFLEDRSFYDTAADQEELVLFFTQSLILSHGDYDNCRMGGNGLYLNRERDPQDLHPNENRYYSQLSACVAEIVQSYIDYDQVDGSHPVPTIDSIAPLGADIVTALNSGYKWTAPDGKYQLTNPIRVPAWFDYYPKFVAPAKDSTNQSEPVPPVFTLQARPNWTKLTPFYVPSGYKAKVYRVNIDPKIPSRTVNVLVPEGYRLARRENGVLRTDSHGEYIAEKAPEVPHAANGRRTRGSRAITEAANISLQDIGSKIAGRGIPSDTTIVAIDPSARTATISNPANLDSDDPLSVGDDGFSDRFSYSDEVVSDLWPVPQNYFYVELRKNEKRPPGQLITDATAERDCHSSTGSDPGNGVVCGYFKIGNLLQIMQRLADVACTSSNPTALDCNFGVGRKAPTWTDTSATFTNAKGTEEYVWVPAHNPV